MSDYDQHLAILRKALSYEIGLVVSTPDPRRTKADFEIAKRKDSTLSKLRIESSRINPDTEIWIIKDTLPMDKENPPNVS